MRHPIRIGRLFTSICLLRSWMVRGRLCLRYMRRSLRLHPSMRFTTTLASQFDCEVTVSNGETDVDGKSIMQMSMLAATCGTRLKIRAEGADAEAAVGALRELVEVRMFDEPASEE